MLQIALARRRDNESKPNRCGPSWLAKLQRAKVLQLQWPRYLLSPRAPLTGCRLSVAPRLGHRHAPPGACRRPVSGAGQEGSPVLAKVTRLGRSEPLVGRRGTRRDLEPESGGRTPQQLGDHERGQLQPASQLWCKSPTSSVLPTAKRARVGDQITRRYTHGLAVGVQESLLPASLHLQVSVGCAK